MSFKMSLCTATQTKTRTAASRIRSVLLCMMLGLYALTAGGCWLFVAGAAGAGAGYVAGNEASDGDDAGDDND